MFIKHVTIHSNQCRDHVADRNQQGSLVPAKSTRGSLTQRQISLTWLLSLSLPVKSRIAVLTSAYLCRKHLSGIRTLSQHQLGPCSPYTRRLSTSGLLRFTDSLLSSGIFQRRLKLSHIGCIKGDPTPESFTNDHNKTANNLLEGGE